MLQIRKDVVPNILYAALAALVMRWDIVAAADAASGADAARSLQAKMEAVRKAGPGLVPLFVIGDVNEDGKVDQQDVVLVRQMAKQGGDIAGGKGISCPAAGDIDQDGRIDDDDAATLATWVRLKVTTPALGYLSVLPCNLARLSIAATPALPRNGKGHVHFIDLKLNATNSSVAVEEGDASVFKAADNRGFDVMAGQAARTGALVVLRITLPAGHAYYYSMRVIDTARDVPPSSPGK